MLKKILKYLLIAAIFTPLIKFSNTVFPFVFAKAIFFQIIISLAFALYMFLLLRGEIGWPKKSWIFRTIIIFLSAITIASLFGVDFAHSFWDTQERMTGIFNLLYYLLLFVMLASVFQEEKEKRQLALAAWVMGVLMMLSGYVQIISPNFWGYEALSRLAGLLNNPIFYAIAMVWQMFLSFFLASLAYSKKKKIIFVIAGLAAFYAIFLSQTRGSVIGAFAGLLMFGLGEVLFIKDKKIKIRILTVIAIFCIAIAALWTFKDAPVIQKLPISYYLNISPFAGTGATRLLAWQAAYSGFLERPVFGWGLNNFNIIFNKFYNPESLRYTAYETWFDRTHNVTLEFLSTTGIVGLSAYLALFGVAFFAAWKAIKRGVNPRPLLFLMAALVAYLIQNQFALDQPTSLLLFFIFLALISLYGEKDIVVTPPKNRYGFILSAIIALVAIITAYRYSVVPLYAGYLDVVGVATETTDYNFSKTQFDQALSISHPYRFDSVLEFVQAVIKQSIDGPMTSETRTTDFNQSEKEMKALIAEHQVNTYYWYLLGRLYAEWGRYDQKYFILGDAAFSEAEKLSPSRQQIFFGRGEMYLFAKQYDRAEATFRHLVALEPRVGEAHWYLALALYKLNKNTETFAELESAYQMGYVPKTRDELDFYVQLFESSKRYTDVALIYDRYIADREPKNGDLYAKEAASWLAAGNFARAREALQTAVHFDSTLQAEATIFSKMIDVAENKLKNKN